MAEASEGADRDGKPLRKNAPMPTQAMPAM
jgi:hypothetical protein